MLKIGSAGLGSDCSVKVTPDGRNRPPRRWEQETALTDGPFFENKREDHCPPFCSFAAFAAYRNRRRVRAFGKLLARLGARSRPLRSPIRDATVGGEPAAANRNVRLGLMTVKANCAPRRTRFNLKPLRIKKWTKTRSAAMNRAAGVELFSAETRGVLIKIDSLNLAAPQKLCANCDPKNKGRGHNEFRHRSHRQAS